MERWWWPPGCCKGPRDINQEKERAGGHRSQEARKRGNEVAVAADGVPPGERSPVPVAGRHEASDPGGRRLGLHWHDWTNGFQTRSDKEWPSRGSSHQPNKRRHSFRGCIRLERSNRDRRVWGRRNGSQAAGQGPHQGRRGVPARRFPLRPPREISVGCRMDRTTGREQKSVVVSFVGKASYDR